MNPYLLSNLDGQDPRMTRVLQDLTDQINRLSSEIEMLRARDLTIMPQGAARKEKPTPGIITIPGQGAPGQIRVTKDGVIHSFVTPPNVSSNGQIIGVPYTILERFDQVPTVGAAATNLHLLTLPANSMEANGDYIEVCQYGIYANTTNTKRLAFGFGLGTIEDTGLIDVRGGLAWQTYYSVVRTSPTTVAFAFTGWFQFIQSDSVPVFAGGFGGRYVTRGLTSGAVNNLNTSTNPINVQGQGTANGDVVQTFTAVKLTRMS